MARHVRVAERIIDFTQDDFETTSKSNPLVVNGKSIIRRYTKEIPIVAYQESRDFTKDSPSCQLNEQIASIYVSVVGWEREVEYHVVAYYEDTKGDNHTITYQKSQEFLLKKPDLTVSPEGILLFYTDKEIMVTTDMEHYCWIKNDRFSSNVDTYIYKIMVNYLDVENPFCEISLIEYEPAHIDQATHTFVPGEKYDRRYAITFHIDESAEQKMIPEIKEMNKRRL